MEEVASIRAVCKTLFVVKKAGSEEECAAGNGLGGERETGGYTRSNDSPGLSPGISEKGESGCFLLHVIYSKEGDPSRQESVVVATEHDGADESLGEEGEGVSGPVVSSHKWKKVARHGGAKNSGLVAHAGDGGKCEKDNELEDGDASACKKNNCYPLIL